MERPKVARLKSELEAQMRQQREHFAREVAERMLLSETEVDVSIESHGDPMGTRRWVAVTVRWEDDTGLRVQEVVKEGRTYEAIATGTSRAFLADAQDVGLVPRRGAT